MFFKGLKDVSDGKLWFISPQGIARLTQALQSLTKVKQGPHKLWPAMSSEVKSDQAHEHIG